MKKRFLRFAIATACCLSITTANGSDSPAGRSATFWGGVEYRDFGETSPGGFMSVVGELTEDRDWASIQLGVDTQVADNLLAGVAISWSQDDRDSVGTGSWYSQRTDTDLTGIHPYLIWSAPDRQMDWWAMVNVTKWDVNSDFPDDPAFDLSYDVDLRTTRAGVSWLFLSRNNAEWRVKSEAQHARSEAIDFCADNGACFTEMKSDSNRLRMALEAKRLNFTVAETQLQPSIQVGLVNYGGNWGYSDGATVEIDSVLRYQDVARGLTLDGRAWALNGISGDYEDFKQWSVSTTLRLARPDWRGLSFTLTSGYGSRTNIHQHETWAGYGSFLDRNPHAWMYIRIAYGLTPHPVWTDCPRFWAGC